MRALRHLLWSALAALLLLLGITPATAQATDLADVTASQGQGGDRAHCPTKYRTRGTNSAPSPPLQRYFHGDWRLGPAHLPRKGPIGEMLRGYNRLGDTSSAYWFLGCYWQTDPTTEKSGWWYPAQDGFVLKDGRPVKRKVTLREGQLVDLFGSGRGNFLAPAGTPYAKRAIPPSNLDTYDKAHPFSYHLYRVTEPFTVDAGPIRPWFGQPGLGLQYVTKDSIPDLITADKLKELAVR